MNSAPCDACFFCRHGQQNLCEHLLFNNGAYAEYMRIPARIVEKNTLLVPAGVPLEHAALTEPLACVVQGLDETNAQAGDTMVVIGAGPIGLMFIHVAHLRGLRVIAVVKRDDQVRAARRFGASEVVQIAEDPHGGTDTVDAVRALTGNCRGADDVIEAVATPATWEAAVAMVRKGGVVNFFGGPPKGTVVGLDTNRLHYGDITLKSQLPPHPRCLCRGVCPDLRREVQVRRVHHPNHAAGGRAGRLRPHDDPQRGQHRRHQDCRASQWLSPQRERDPREWVTGVKRDWASRTRATRGRRDRLARRRASRSI